MFTDTRVKPSDFEHGLTYILLLTIVFIFSEAVSPGKTQLGVLPPFITHCRLVADGTICVLSVYTWSVSVCLVLTRPPYYSGKGGKTCQLLEDRATKTLTLPFSSQILTRTIRKHH